MAPSRKGPNRHKKAFMTTHSRTPSVIPSRRQRRKLNRIRHAPLFINQNHALHCSAKPGVCNLLALPREIRNLIYPMVIEDLNSTIRSGRGVTRPEEHNNHYFTVYRTRLPNINTAGLLRTNHQIREETIQAIKSKITTSDRGISYRLLLIDHGYYRVPIWLTRSAPPRFIKSLEVYFTMFALEMSEWTHAWDARLPGKLSHLLLQMLRRFLNYGPRFKPRKANCIRKDEITIALPLKALTINFLPIALRYGMDLATGRVSLMQRRTRFIGPA